jgi:F-type H+-transporting ATPase subunit a
MKEALPELPKFIELLHKSFPNSSWTIFLLHWENIIFSLFAASLVALLFYFGLRRSKLIPSKMQNFLEFILETFQKLVLGVLGREGEKHIPFLGTLFIYILSMNWFGLIPLMKTPSASLSITAALALCVFIYVQYFNIKHMGLLGFLYHLAGSPKNWITWLLVPLMIPLEVLTQLSRPVTLALRLCGNMLGEHILMGVFAMMGVLGLTVYLLPVSLPLQIPFTFLSLLTGLMQALVFTMLSTVYIFLSIPHKSEQTVN